MAKIKREPKESEFWDDTDPRGPSTREIEAYQNALRKWNDTGSWEKPDLPNQAVDKKLR